MLHQIRIQKQDFVVLPQQIELLKLFHLNTLELQHHIQEELSENPLLEENSISESSDESSKETIQDYQDEEEYQYDDIPDYKQEHNNFLSEHDFPKRPLSDRFDFRKDLKEQVRFSLKNENEIELADYLIDSLNSSGMLDQNLEEITDDYSFRKRHIVEPSEIEKIRTILKELEPGGLGCFTIKEFLLFQLSKKIYPDAKKAINLIENYFGKLNLWNKGKIINRDDLGNALQLIRSCKSKPWTEIDTSGWNATVIPDFIIRRDGECYDVTLYHQRSATLFINQSMSQKISKQSKTDRETLNYLKNKLTSAEWFVNAIKKREIMMHRVMKVIVDLQYDYFKNGDITFLKPMVLKNIRDVIGLDIPSISRITCNKYADTHFGIVRLKDLFSEGIKNTDGKNISNRVIRSVISEAVENEDKKNPLTDQQLVTTLSVKGLLLARRTVAKYREQLHIPAVQLRAIWTS